MSRTDTTISAHEMRFQLILAFSLFLLQSDGGCGASGTVYSVMGNIGDLNVLFRQLRAVWKGWETGLEPYGRIIRVRRLKEIDAAAGIVSASPPCTMDSDNGFTKVTIVYVSWRTSLIFR